MSEIRSLAASEIQRLTREDSNRPHHIEHNLEMVGK